MLCLRWSLPSELLEVRVLGCGIWRGVFASWRPLGARTPLLPLSRHKCCFESQGAADLFWKAGVATDCAPVLWSSHCCCQSLVSRFIFQLADRLAAIRCRQYGVWIFGWGSWLACWLRHGHRSGS